MDDLYGKALDVVFSSGMGALRQSVMTPKHKEREEEPAEQRPSERPEMPTTAETVQELKRRLAKELWRMESDLITGGRINNAPCDCFLKHTIGVEALSEELISMDKNPIYGRILVWLNGHAPEFPVEEVAKRPPEHYQALAPEVRAFRKELMGTEKLVALLTPEETEQVTKKAVEMVKGELTLKETIGKMERGGEHD